MYNLQILMKSVPCLESYFLSIEGATSLAIIVIFDPVSIIVPVEKFPFQKKIEKHKKVMKLDENCCNCEHLRFHNRSLDKHCCCYLLMIN